MDAEHIIVCTDISIFIYQNNIHCGIGIAIYDRHSDGDRLIYDKQVHRKIVRPTSHRMEFRAVLIAMRTVLPWATELTASVTFVSDCKQAIERLHCMAALPSAQCPKDFNVIMKSIPSVKFVKGSKQAVQRAHRLARLAALVNINNELAHRKAEILIRLLATE